MNTTVTQQTLLRVLGFAWLMLLASCITSNSRVTLCTRPDGTTVTVEEPDPDVIAKAVELDLIGKAKRGEKIVAEVDLSIEVNREIERIRTEKPEIDSLVLKLYLLGLSYCSGGVDHNTYQRLTASFYEGLSKARHRAGMVTLEVTELHQEGGRTYPGKCTLTYELLIGQERRTFEHQYPLQLASSSPPSHQFFLTEQDVRRLSDIRLSWSAEEDIHEHLVYRDSKSIASSKDLLPLNANPGAEQSPRSGECKLEIAGGAYGDRVKFKWSYTPLE